MTDYYLTLIGFLFLVTAALTVYITSLTHYSTPTPCLAVKLVLQNPGSELVVYGKFRVFEEDSYVYLTCGLKIERQRVLYIEKTEGVLRVGSTSDGLLYIR